MAVAESNIEPTVAIVTPKPLVGWCVLQNFTNSNCTLPPFHTFPLTPLFPLNLTAVPASKHEYQLFEKVKSSFINWLTAWMCQYVWDYEAELCTQRRDPMTYLFQVFFKKYTIQM